MSELFCVSCGQRNLRRMTEEEMRAVGREDNTGWECQTCGVRFIIEVT